MPTDLPGHEPTADADADYRRLVQSFPETIVRYGRDGRIRYVNDEFTRRTGRTGDDVVGAFPFEWTDGDERRPDVELYRRLLHETLTTGEPRQMERSRSVTGAADIHRVRFQAERDADGTIVGAFAVARDVNELEQARRDVTAREHEFRTLAENMPDIVLRYDVHGRTVYVNPQHDERVNIHAADLIGKRPSEIDVVGMTGVDEYERALMLALTTGEPTQCDITLLDPSGERRNHQVLFRAERDATGAITGGLAIGRDVTDLVRAKEATADRERVFRTLAENATDFIGRWDHDARRIYVNPALATLMGGTPDTLLGHRSVGGPTGQFVEMSKAIHQVIADQRPLTTQQRFVDRTTHEERIHDVQLVPEFDADGVLASVLVIGRDISEVVHQREALERSSRTDALTGVSSRQVLYERLPDVLALSEATGGRAAILLVDLDGFKQINDHYGHRLGDRILRRVGRRLAECVGERDLLVRVGGDEFVIVLAGIDDPTDASFFAHRARLALTALDEEEDRRYPSFDASVGIAIYPDHGSDVDALLAHADLALYDAKRSGRGRVEFFRPELRAAMERRSTLEQALRDCLPDAEMAVHLQPICSLGPDPHVWGAEALLRWQHPVLGAIGPTEFIPIAEQSGQIVPIGRWVLRRAAEVAVELNVDRAHPLRIAVNVSTRQFTLDDVACAIREALDATGCDPHWLVVELTESLLLEDLPLVNRSLDEVRRLGVAIAIDDFGTGYSALHYLTRLKIDHMKIDKAFVRDTDVDSQQQEIVRALVAMADALGIGIVAEGVETAGQAAFLQGLGCRLGQGFLLAHPLTLGEFQAWLATAGNTLRAALPV